MTKKILVTGAAGFIGFHLCSSLIKKGYRVLGIDNFNNYYDPTLKRKRAEILAQQGLSVVEADLENHSFLKTLVQENQVDHLIHLAAQAGVRYSLENPQAYLKTNIDGFLNILEICRAYPHIKLLYASSSSVYGLNEKSPFSEDDRTDHQASLYGVTKKTNELMAHSYHHLFGIKAIGLRFFTVYGPWGRPDMAYMLFADAITKGKPINVFNHGKMKRDFTYIDDIIKGIEAALEADIPFDVFNLGNHRPVELIHFIEILEKALGKKAIKNFLPLQSGDVLETYADIKRSSKKLNFFPETNLETGLEAFVKWYQDFSISSKIR